MKHLFSAFPDGLAGVALLLLRGSLALFLVMTPVGALSLPLWLFFLLGLAAIALSIGVATRILAGLCAVAGAVVVLHMGSAMAMPFVTQAIDAAALALIGPGAFSVDARLFGRRTFHLRS